MWLRASDVKIAEEPLAMEKNYRDLTTWSQLRARTRDKLTRARAVLALAEDFR